MNGNKMDVTGYKHIYWRSRRGMLELELKLVPFVRDQFHLLSVAERQAYEAMLEEEDWQIFDWIQQREIPQDVVLKRVVEKIRQTVGRL